MLSTGPTPSSLRREIRIIQGKNQALKVKVIADQEEFKIFYKIVGMTSRKSWPGEKEAEANFISLISQEETVEKG